MRPERNIEEQVKRLRHPVDAGTHDKILAHLLAKLQQRKNQQAAGFQSNLRRIIMTRPIGKLAVAATIVAVTCIGISQLGGSLENVAWADVAERFESVPFFHLTIYLGRNGSEQAHKIEIWKSQAPLVRAHEGNRVFFASPAKLKTDILGLSGDSEEIVAFDRSTRQPVDPCGPARTFLAILCPEGRFSLDTLMSNTMDPEDMPVSTLETVDTPASKETVLFEATHNATSERLLIWALRDSRLPVRLRFVDPRNDECADFLFDYSQDKPAAFFDPNAFAHGQG
jgi:hypothetical protein